MAKAFDFKETLVFYLLDNIFISEADSQSKTLSLLSFANKRTIIRLGDLNETSDKKDI